MSQYQVRGGNSGFLQNGVVITSDATSCLRRALLRHHKIEEPKNGKTQKVFGIGALNENWWENYFKQKNITYVKEKPFIEAVTALSDFCGHSDFVVEDPDIGTCVYELKSVTSQNTYNKVFKKSEYKLANLAQAVNYMVAQETDKGRLVYSSYIEAVEYKDLDMYSLEDIIEKIDLITPEHKIFEINIKENGKIFIDGQFSSFSIQDVLAHRNETARLLELNQVAPDGPQNISSGMFDSPCGFCPFKVVCNKSVKSMSTEDFLTQCKEIVIHE